MKFIGKFGEHLVLANLLSKNIEAYPALKTNQDSYDITAILENKKVIRIQVKSTELNNSSTNNTIGALNRDYDFLVVVVVDTLNTSKCFVLSSAEAKHLIGSSKQLAISQRKAGVFSVRKEFEPHEGQWAKIRDA